MPATSPGLFADEFAPRVSPNPVFCHQEFLEKLEANRHNAVGKRASLLLQRLAVDERRLHFKATQGVNRGWRRSRLGGNQGSHFYAWWAPAGAPPMREGRGFDSAPQGAIFLRDIRHHDDHSLAQAHSFDDNYLPVTVAEIRHNDYGPSPWTPPQARFASARQSVRLLKGHPGSGKTTALLNAVDETGAGRVLYLTYSQDLAALARLHFDRYCSRERVFHVSTFDALLAEILGEAPAIVDVRATRACFRAAVAPFARYIAPWNEYREALYDELYAHLVGSAVPIGAGRFAATRGPRVGDREYRQARSAAVGQAAANMALEAVARLERADKQPLADRYFPELAVAWRAANRLVDAPKDVPSSLLQFDCIAVDECQDLTPLEAFVVVQLAAISSKGRRLGVPLLLAGDEAQTVRPSDFEWAWLSDMLHDLAGKPTEFQLGVNLRSPRRLARLVNQVWDLYGFVDKRDRPGGTGYAEMADDAADQILYCTAAPGGELNDLLETLSRREGLAIVALNEESLAQVPEAVRSSVLTPEEIKGLDFHSVCVLGAGQSIERISKVDDRMAAFEIDSLRRRLNIDALRVALSRPTERLIWLDIQPTREMVQRSLRFLNLEITAWPVAPAIPSAIQKTLEEEALDVEERIQRCQSDARQFLDVRPELALSRVQGAVALLGERSSPVAVLDEALRRTVHLTAAEICFRLGYRGASLPPELGRRNLFQEAAMAARHAERPGLCTIILHIAEVLNCVAEERVRALIQLCAGLADYQAEIEPWLLTTIADRATGWLAQLESSMSTGNGDAAALLGNLLPLVYQALRLPDAQDRKRALEQRAIQILIKNRNFAAALGLLRRAPERDIRLEAACLRGQGLHQDAAAAFREAGDLAEALACYRAIPDFDQALALIRELGGEHAASESYAWLGRLRQVIADKPAEFNRVMQASEKKVLEQTLEAALGVGRKKTAAKKTATKKTATKKTAARKTPARKRAVAPEPF